MVRLEILSHYLDTLLKIGDVVDDLPNGLVLKGKENVNAVGLATHTTFEVNENAKKREVDFLLAHHGGWKELEMNLFDAKMSELRNNEISLYVAHSSLDNASEFGTGDSLARLLEVVPSGKLARYGSGMAGVYGTITPTKFHSFCRRISRVVEGARIESWRNGDEYVTKLAVVTGKGERTEWLEEAYGLGCNTYLTGEGNAFTKIFAKETKMNLIFAGHTATERPGVLALGRKIKEAFKDMHIVELKETFY